MGLSGGRSRLGVGLWMVAIGIIATVGGVAWSYADTAGGANIGAGGVIFAGIWSVILGLALAVDGWRRRRRRLD